MVKKTNHISHVLIPKHSKLTEKEKTKILKHYNIKTRQLPKISKKDPAISHLDVSVGDVIEITRLSPTAGKSIFYRVVTND